MQRSGGDFALTSMAFLHMQLSRLTFNHNNAFASVLSEARCALRHLHKPRLASILLLVARITASCALTCLNMLAHVIPSFHTHVHNTARQTQEQGEADQHSQSHVPRLRIVDISECKEEDGLAGALGL